MAELKTLQDISVCAFNSEETEDQAVWVSSLKEEAIKWVKRLGHLGRIQSMKDMMDFFNLTAEDIIK